MKVSRTIEVPHLSEEINEMKKAVSDIKKLNELKTQDKGNLTAEQPAKSKIESGPIVEGP